MASLLRGLVYSTPVCPGPNMEMSLSAAATAAGKSGAWYIASTGHSFSSERGSSLPIMSTCRRQME
jgi:hypothetical protein